MNCPFCGADYLEGDESCSVCGQDLTAVGLADGELAATSFGRIRDVPLNEPLALEKSATVADAVALMRERRHGSVQVIDGGCPVGIFTEADLVRRVDPTADLTAIAITDVMTADPECFSPRGSIAHALNGMAARGYRHLPVVGEADQIEGFVSVRGLLAHIRSRAGL